MEIQTDKLLPCQRAMLTSHEESKGLGVYRMWGGGIRALRAGYGAAGAGL